MLPFNCNPPIPRFNYLWCLLLVLLTTITFPTLGQQNREEEKVKKVIVDAFQAIADIDLPNLRSYCQPDFILLEDGQVWTIDTLENRLRPNLGSGMKRVNTIDFIKVTVRGPVAWVSYHNTADITRNNKQRQVRWLESAVLEKMKGEWKLALLHSTVLEAKK
ncbi:nuclear transport factor 2 family protein [Larkinella sp. VNQ87]|uniref:nuclear transport factor 2 family protein n=1 Tax=Larkinella sp. VNQ87 TaxID=3400921 RepID=UPI003C084A74